MLTRPRIVVDRYPEDVNIVQRDCIFSNETDVFGGRIPATYPQQARYCRYIPRSAGAFL